MTGAACIPALRALGDENRLRILRLVAKSPITVGEISGDLGLAEYNVSKHLRILREAGLVQFQRRGRECHYGVPDRLRGAFSTGDGVLDLGCCTFRLDRLPK